MINDIVIVFFKEWNEYLHARSSVRGTMMMVFFPVLLFGAIFPLQAGREWVESSISIISFAWLPLIFVSAMTADSFAGERERHTLETLLASRLSDSGILFGKFLAAMSYGLLMTALIVLTGLVTVNAAHGHGEFLFYPVRGFIWGMILCILASGLIAGIGVLVSIRASTVRQAHQTLSFGIIAVAFTPMIALKVIPKATRISLMSSFSGIDGNTLLLVIALVLLAVNALILWTASKRFVRVKMSLD